MIDSAARSGVVASTEQFDERRPLDLLGHIIWHPRVPYGIGVLCGSIPVWKHLDRRIEEFRDIVQRCSLPEWAVDDVDIFYHDCQDTTMKTEDIVDILNKNRVVILENAGWVFIHHLDLMKKVCKAHKSIFILQFDGVFLSTWQWEKLKCAGWWKSGMLACNLELYNIVAAEVDGDSSIRKDLLFVRQYNYRVYPLVDHFHIPWDIIPSNVNSGLRGSTIDPSQWHGVPHDGVECSQQDMETQYDCRVLRERMSTFCTKDHKCHNRPEHFKYPTLAVVQSKMMLDGEHQLGVVPLEYIPKGGFICEMKGSVISSISSQSSRYLMNIGDQNIELKGVGALVNHQCKHASCKCIRINDPEHGTIRCFLVATRDINPGEELTWKYADKVNFTCCCGHCTSPIPLPAAKSPADHVLQDLITGLAEQQPLHAANHHLIGFDF